MHANNKYAEKDIEILNFDFIRFEVTLKAPYCLCKSGAEPLGFVEPRLKTTGFDTCAIQTQPLVKHDSFPRPASAVLTLFVAACEFLLHHLEAAGFLRVCPFSLHNI